MCSGWRSDSPLRQIHIRSWRLHLHPSKILVRLFDQAFGGPGGGTRVEQVDPDGGQAWGCGGFDRRKSHGDPAQATARPSELESYSLQIWELGKVEGPFKLPAIYVRKWN